MKNYNVQSLRHFTQMLTFKGLETKFIFDNWLLVINVLCRLPGCILNYIAKSEIIHQTVQIYLDLQGSPTLSYIQQFCSRQLWKHTRIFLETPLQWKYNHWIELKTWWQKEKLLVLSNFFFCLHVFKKLSAAEVSQSVYIRECVKVGFHVYHLKVRRSGNGLFWQLYTSQ